MKVAVVHNGNHEGVVCRFGRPCPEHYSLRHVQMVVDALQQSGHHVALLEADVSLFDSLRHFLASGDEGRASGPSQIPPTGSADNGGGHGMVFNMAYGIQGDARYTHLPAMLELAGVPYTGSNPLGHALALDKVITKILMIEAGVPTPRYEVRGTCRRSETWDRHVGHASPTRLRFPLVVKPRHESTSYGLRLVHDQNELDAAVDAIIAAYEQEALVEEYIDGREVCIGLLGNDPVEFLPPVELDFGNRGLRLMTWDDKYHKRMDEPSKVCPAPLDPDMISRLNKLSLATFRACHLRDYARVDIRIDPEGNPFVLEVNSMASLGGGGSYVTAASAAGYSFVTLVNRILEAATRRYSGPASPHCWTTPAVVMETSDRLAAAVT